MGSTTKQNLIRVSSTASTIASQSSREFERLARTGDVSSVRISIESQTGEITAVSLPEETLGLIASVLREVGHGKTVRIVTTDAEVTTQEAADILNVSRPYFVKLLTQGRIPFRTVGARRRVLVDDLMSYKARESAKRNAAVDGMVAENQKLGLY
ncbi:MAG TPA: helix-turn-helix domain-containing protein [Capsulimonadaceae bacterium]